MTNHEVLGARLALILILGSMAAGAATAKEERPGRPRARALGLDFGALATGPHNDITDVAGVQVGHFTLRQPPRFNTGITAVLPHAGNIFLEKVPAAVAVGNGFGKMAGSTQVAELGEIETPVLLTGTLNVPKVADGLVSAMLSLPGMEEVRSINPVVGETNDGYLSDIRTRPLGVKEVRQALEAAGSGPVPMGAVGAGAGTVCFGFKGGIGSASRRLGDDQGGWTVGVLVQSNFGGVLRLPGVPSTIEGVPLGEHLKRFVAAEEARLGKGAGDQSARGDSPSFIVDSIPPSGEEGSLMIVVATDAPLDARNLGRLAKRSFHGMARTGGFASNGSGDYAIAFSTHAALRIRPGGAGTVVPRPLLGNDAMSPLFQAVADATEEAIVDSLFAAEDTAGHRGLVHALPVAEVLSLARLPIPEE